MTEEKKSRTTSIANRIRDEKSEPHRHLPIGKRTARGDAQTEPPPAPLPNEDEDTEPKGAA